MGRTARKHAHQRQKPLIIFTIHDLSLLQKALAVLEKRIRLTSEPLPNLGFALEVVVHLQSKIRTMLRESKHGSLVGFDENEMLLLRTALFLYMTALRSMEVLAKNNTLIGQCEKLARKLEV